MKLTIELTDAQYAAFLAGKGDRDLTDANYGAEWFGSILDQQAAQQTQARAQEVAQAYVEADDDTRTAMSASVASIAVGAKR